MDNPEKLAHRVHEHKTKKNKANTQYNMCCETQNVKTQKNEQHRPYQKPG